MTHNQLYLIYTLSFPLLKSDSLSNYFDLSGTDLYLLLHRTEENGLSASAQPSDWRHTLVSRPDGSRSFLYPASGRHWNHVLHPGGGRPNCRTTSKSNFEQ